MFDMKNGPTPIPAGTEFWLGAYGQLGIGEKPAPDEELGEPVLICTSTVEVPANAEFFIHGGFTNMTLSLEPPSNMMRIKITRDDIINDGLCDFDASYSAYMATFKEGVRRLNDDFWRRFVEAT